MKNNLTMLTKKEIISGVINLNSTGFIKLTQFYKTLSVDERKRMNIPPKATQIVIKDQLTPLPDNYEFKKKGLSSYLVLKVPPEDLMTPNTILEMIHNYPEKTVAELSNTFPFEKKLTVRLIIGHANEMLKEKKLTVQLSPQGLAKLSYKPQNELAPDQQTQELSIPVLPVGTKNRVKAFKIAYDAVGKGLPFVFIFKIRRRLKWPREAFDQVLAHLRKEGYIAAHTGNPGDLSTEDVIDSYQDSYGDLYITANWRKPI